VKLLRAEVIQGLLAIYEDPAYLEIGVSKGATFHAIEATRKVAVDPRFRFDATEAQRRAPEAEYHEVPSDEYFGRVADPEDRFHVIYLDGLHTLEQTLRDFTNAQGYLVPGGAIVIDDVYPSSYVASMPNIDEHRVARREFNVTRGAWMGDVYRLVFFIETFFQQFSYRTVAENHGQLVVWRGRREAVPQRRVEEVGRLPYERVALDREAFAFTPFTEIIDEVRAAVAQPTP
jgi:hypothetical protein